MPYDCVIDGLNTALMSSSKNVVVRATMVKSDLWGGERTIIYKEIKFVSAGQCRQAFCWPEKDCTCHWTEAHGALAECSNAIHQLQCALISDRKFVRIEILIKRCRMRIICTINLQINRRSIFPILSSEKRSQHRLCNTRPDTGSCLQNGWSIKYRLSTMATTTSAHHPICYWRRTCNISTSDWFRYECSAGRWGRLAYTIWRHYMLHISTKLSWIAEELVMCVEKLKKIDGALKADVMPI